MAKLALLAFFKEHSNGIRLIFFPASDKIGSLEEEIPSCKSRKKSYKLESGNFPAPLHKTRNNDRHAGRGTHPSDARQYANDR